MIGMMRLLVENWPLAVGIGLLILALWRTGRAWARFERGGELADNLKAKLSELYAMELSLNAMSAATGAALTGASITLAVIGAIVGLGNVPGEARMWLRASVVLSGVSVFWGVVLAGWLPQHAGLRNVALVPKLGVALAGQTYAMLLGMVSLMFGVWATLQG